MGRGSRNKAKSKNKGHTKSTAPTAPAAPAPTAPAPAAPTAPEPTPIKTDVSPEASDTEFEVPEGPDDESLESLQSITPTMKMKPLHKRLEPPAEEPAAEEPPAEEPAAEEPPAEEPAAEEPAAEEPAAEEPPAEEPPAEEAPKEIVPKEDAKIVTYKDIFKTINDFYEQNKGIEETFTELNSVINNMTDKMFDETFETIAEGIFNTTINGKKVFNTLEDAKKFIYEIRHNGKKGFRGQNVLKYKLPKKLQEGLRQEKQEKQQLTPMMVKNIKQITSSKYIYQY